MPYRENGGVSKGKGADFLSGEDCWKRKQLSFLVEVKCLSGIMNICYPQPESADLRIEVYAKLLKRFLSLSFNL